MDTYTRKCHSCSIETDCLQYVEPDSTCEGINLIWLCEECSPDEQAADEYDDQRETYRLPTVDDFNPMEALDDLVQEAKQLTKKYGK